MQNRFAEQEQIDAEDRFRNQEQSRRKSGPHRLTAGAVAHQKKHVHIERGAPCERSDLSDKGKNDQHVCDHRNRRPLDPHLQRHRRTVQEREDQKTVCDQEQNQPLQYIETHHDVGGDQHEDARQHQKRALGFPMPEQEDHEKRCAEDHLPEHAQSRLVRKEPECQLRFQHGDTEDAEADPDENAGLSAVAQQKQYRPDEDRDDDTGERCGDHQRQTPVDPGGADSDELRKVRRFIDGGDEGVRHPVFAGFRPVCRTGAAAADTDRIGRQTVEARSRVYGAIRNLHFDGPVLHGFPFHDEIVVVRNGNHARFADPLHIIGTRERVEDCGVAGKHALKIRARTQLALVGQRDRKFRLGGLGQKDVDRTADEDVGKGIVVLEDAVSDQIDVRKIRVLAMLVKETPHKTAGILIRIAELGSGQHVAEHAEYIVYERVHIDASEYAGIALRKEQTPYGGKQIGCVLVLHDADDRGLQGFVVLLAVLRHIHDHGQQQTHAEVQRGAVVRLDAERVPRNFRTVFGEGLADGGELRHRNEPIGSEPAEVPVVRHNLRHDVHRVDDVEDVFISAFRRIQNRRGRRKGIGVDVFFREHAVAHKQTRGDVGHRRRARKAGDPDLDVAFDAVGQDIARKTVDDKLGCGEKSLVDLAAAGGHVGLPFVSVAAAAYADRDQREGLFALLLHNP